ncbi:MAG: hypothetical protein ACOCWM_03105 [Cyclobacteriaceae bacterium]
MKHIRFIIQVFLISMIISCDKNPICPDEPDYHFFASDELKLLWVNVDSALIFQNNLETGIIGQYDMESFYGNIDTVLFTNHLYDTLSFRYEYNLIPGINQWCANAIPMIAKSSLYTIEESFIKEIEIKLEKAITDELRYKIEFVFKDGMDLGTSFSLSDSVKIDFNIFNGEVDKTTVIYLKTYKSNYQFENMNIEECLFFLFYDQNHTEKFKIIYSNNHGFLNLIKNNNHEITRLF